MSDIYVISTGRNANKLIDNCVQSVQQQTLSCKSHIIIDDVSDDDTVQYLEKHKHLDSVEVKINMKRKYRLKNIYENAVNKNSEDIICIVDSDDWLAKKTALQKIKEAYENNSKLEYVYSKYMMTHGAQGCSAPIPNDNWDPYNGQWITSHMSTFKVKALKKILTDNFLDWDDEWFTIATDHALTLPILYQLWKKHGNHSAIGFIDEPLYMHTFYGNTSKPRYGTPEADERAKLSVKCANYIKQRGYIGEII